MTTITIASPMPLSDWPTHRLRNAGWERTARTRIDASLPWVSYDLYMLAPEPGVDPMDQLERMESTEAPARDPDDEPRMRRLADALGAADPRYVAPPHRVSPVGCARESLRQARGPDRARGGAVQCRDGACRPGRGL